VVKVLSCKTHKLGAKAYGCTNIQCSHEKRVCNTCKSKLCTSCGPKVTERWIAVIHSILPDCKYRHITFTMPKAFWVIFQYNRWLLTHLFSLAANRLISLAKKRDLTVGIFAALHTYVRQVNFNCHIHLSIAEFGLNRHGKLKTFSFKFGLLMKQWRYGIINLLRSQYSALVLPSELEAEGDSLQS
jgi:hypothetical protein